MLSSNLLKELEQGVTRSINGGRLEKESDNILKWRPYYHGSISIPDSLGSWQLFTPTSNSGCVYFNISQNKDISGNVIIANTNYDVFATSSGDTFYLTMVPWSSINERGFLTTTRGGVVTYAGARNQNDRYLGAIRTTSSGTFQDSETQRFVCNVTNRIQKIVKTYNSSSSTWTTTTDSVWREFWNGTNQVRGEFIYLWSNDLLYGVNQTPSQTDFAAISACYYSLSLNSAGNPSISLYARQDGSQSYVPSERAGVFLGTPILGYNYITQVVATLTARTLNAYSGDRGGAYLVVYI